MTFIIDLPTTEEGWQRQTNYSGVYSGTNTTMGGVTAPVYRQSLTISSAGDTWKFTLRNIEDTEVEISGRSRHRQKVDGRWSRWGKTSRPPVGPVPSCGETETIEPETETQTPEADNEPAVPVMPPIDFKVLHCNLSVAGHIVDYGSTEGQEAEYEVEWRHGAGDWQKDPENHSHLGRFDRNPGGLVRFNFERPEDPATDVIARIRGRGRTQAEDGTWKTWTAGTEWRHYEANCQVPTNVSLVCADYGNGDLIATGRRDGNDDAAEYIEGYRVRWLVAGRSPTLWPRPAPYIDGAPTQTTRHLAADAQVRIEVQARDAQRDADGWRPRGHGRAGPSKPTGWPVRSLRRWSSRRGRARPTRPRSQPSARTATPSRKATQTATAATPQPPKGHTATSRVTANGQPTSAATRRDCASHPATCACLRRTAPAQPESSATAQAAERQGA